ncbi:heme ABC transporter permease [Aureimonas leprariae]|uniref:Heme exporter protein C n=1 Tax=Plantimonas leprariae TaxID=2615207 RepID=A0A7V7PRA6_9HYPH|nr:heme ABC transporter permease [Aureimonas leprariae]KAB0681195.1 heme ABC transporter permease [Aureimonas leprariae]
MTDIAAVSGRPGRWSVLANPTRFLQLSGRVQPFAYLAAAAVLAPALWLGLTAPADYQQGDTVRIMFVHVPFAWLGMLAWTMMALSGLGTLVWRHPIADVSLKSAAPLGCAFTFLAMVTGSIWGRPTWGTWWEWDARLSSVFILFLMYLGLMALARAFDDPGRSARPVAVMALTGFVMIPIIKFSVEWWNTLHQPASVMRAGGPTMPAAYLTPLLLSALGFTLLFLAMHLTAMRTEVLRRRVRALKRLQVARGTD